MRNPADKVRLKAWVSPMLKCFDSEGSEASEMAAATMPSENCTSVVA